MFHGLAKASLSKHFTASFLRNVAHFGQQALGDGVIARISTDPDKQSTTPRGALRSGSAKHRFGSVMCLSTAAYRPLESAWPVEYTKRLVVSIFLCPKCACGVQPHCPPACPHLSRARPSAWLRPSRPVLGP